MDIRERIEQANAKAAEVLTKGRPAWVDVRPAGEVIPGMTPDTILIAGPPIAVENIPLPVRTAICGALIHEGRAADLDSAWQMVLSGKIQVHAAQDYNAACGAAMATSASMPVCVVEDTVYGGKGFCALHPGNKQNVLRWGYYNDEIESDLVWFRDHYGPELGAAVRRMGGIDLINVMSKTAGMGGNGVEFGIRFAGTGKQWFTVPASCILSALSMWIWAGWIIWFLPQASVKTPIRCAIWSVKS